MHKCTNIIHFKGQQHIKCEICTAETDLQNTLHMESSEDGLQPKM